MKSRPSSSEPRLHVGIVLRVEEDACEILVDGRPVRAVYVDAFPSPRTERVSPGHLVAVAGAVVVFRWYDAVILGPDGERVRMWEPSHGEVLATARDPHRHRRPGTRAYLSAGLLGADWWVAGPATGAEDAEVELDEVERFCAERGLLGGG